ncbi:hypothetical protein FIBSPDRAFT_849119 [Athelia psychrophila]|uniref:EXPERA domain-containing protein n=1 Tax=Athelia psychrophila TaxID=1759441 RepID=A0A166UXJ4_9AGAM|nr:hypothetical protein FIBSPDRAFT_849119 [Fibularhizoctonia sp. CBS 109695]
MGSVKTHSWISLWFAVTVPVILWDASYLFMRPRSMVGGDLHWIWKPYEIYQEIDYIYGVKALIEGDGFPNAQSFLNIIETAFNILYLYCAHVSSWAGAPLIGFGAAVMTLSKTMLYGLQEYYCGGCSVGHNNLRDLVVYYFVPNGLWIVIPSLIVLSLGKDIAGALKVADKVVAGKTQ